MTKPPNRHPPTPVQCLSKIHNMLASIPIFVATAIGLCTVLKLAQASLLARDQPWVSAEILLDCANLSTMCLGVFGLFHGCAVALTLYAGWRWPPFYDAMWVPVILFFPTGPLWFWSIHVCPRVTVTNRRSHSLAASHTQLHLWATDTAAFGRLTPPDQTKTVIPRPISETRRRAAPRLFQ